MHGNWEERVRVRAHAIWEREGRPDGGGEQHWVLAEEQLRTLSRFRESRA